MLNRTQHLSVIESAQALKACDMVQHTLRLLVDQKCMNVYALNPNKDLTNVFVSWTVFSLLQQTTSVANLK